MGKDQKAQLGARVRPDAREIAVARAEAEGMSLNEYIEKLIRADSNNHVLPVEHPPEQTTILNPPVMVITTATQPDDGQMVEYKRFDPACSNGTYHWRHNPGNPCKRCGGMI